MGDPTVRGILSALNEIGLRFNEEIGERRARKGLFEEPYLGQLGQDASKLKTDMVAAPLALLDTIARLHTQGATGRQLPHGPLESREREMMDTLPPLTGLLAAVAPGFPTKAANVPLTKLERFLKREGVPAADMTDTAGAVLGSRLSGEGPFTDVLGPTYGQEQLEGMFGRGALEQADLVPFLGPPLDAPSRSIPNLVTEQPVGVDPNTQPQRWEPSDEDLREIAAGHRAYAAAIRGRVGPMDSDDFRQQQTRNADYWEDQARRVEGTLQEAHPSRTAAAVARVNRLHEIADEQRELRQRFREIDNADDEHRLIQEFQRLDDERRRLGFRPRHGGIGRRIGRVPSSDRRDDEPLSLPILVEPEE